MAQRTGRHPTTYNRGAIRFHWISAVLILALWPIGKIMTRTDGPPSPILYPAHVIIGLAVAVLTIGRIWWMIRNPRPEHLDMPRWERILFSVNHWILYILLALLSLSGVAMLVDAGSLDAMALAKNGGPSEQHATGSTVFLIMFVMHVAGVVYYQVRKGQTLRRMGLAIGQ